MEAKTRAGRFPCGVCRDVCVFNCLKCCVCNTWFHSNCQSISASDLKIWGDIDLGFICRQCRTVDGTESFDYLTGMERLRKAASSKNMNILTEAVEREMLFRVEIHIPEELPRDFLDIDITAAEVLDNYCDDLTGNPRTTTGDGNCLFNAISILLTGNESLSLALRYHTCLNMVQNRNIYMLHPLRARIHNLSCSYTKTCIDAATVGAYSNAWTVIALVDVVQMPVRIVYPNANGKEDVAFKTLNTSFAPRESVTSRHLCVLWYRMDTVPRKGVWYEVNHFAAVTDAIETVREGLNHDNKHSTPYQSPIKLGTSPRKECTRISKKQRFTSEESLMGDRDISTGNRFQCLSDRSDGEEENNKEETEAVYETRIETASGETLQEAPHFKQLTGNRFLTNEEAFHLLLHTNSELRAIPRGRKDNSYVIIQYAQQHATRNDFPDDCEVWDSKSGTTVKHDFILKENSMLKTIYKKEGKFCSRKTVNKKFVYTEISPEPTEVVTLHRYYIKLKGDVGFRKRVTTVTCAPERVADMKKRALIEYLGTQSVSKIPHGNSKSGSNYTRTDPRILSDAYGKIGEKKNSRNCSKYECRG